MWTCSESIEVKAGVHELACRYVSFELVSDSHFKFCFCLTLVYWHSTKAILLLEREQLIKKRHLLCRGLIKNRIVLSDQIIEIHFDLWAIKVQLKLNPSSHCCTALELLPVLEELESLLLDVHCRRYFLARVWE